MLTIVFLSCWFHGETSKDASPRADDSTASTDTDTGTCGDGHPVSSDTAACADDSSSYDRCNWCLREVSPCARELARITPLDAWDGAALGITVIYSTEELEAWWVHVGTTGSMDVDFSTEVAVGAIVASSAGCDEGTFLGLAEGDAPGTWFAGVRGRRWCDSACEDYVATATLTAIPMGEVTACSLGTFCDG